MKVPSQLTEIAWLRDLLHDPFKRAVVVVLVLIGITVSWFDRERHEPPLSEGKTIRFYFHPSCPHCREQEKFNRYLKSKYPEVVFIENDTSRPENLAELRALVGKRLPSTAKLGVPLTIIGPYTVSGFDAPDTTGATLEKAIQAYLRDDPALFDESGDAWRQRETIVLPLLGEIRPAEYSLPVLAVIVGLVDGFNPCAMWVLVYLVSLIATLQDRRKIWFLVGSFVLASGVLYFLFMTAWLNAFLAIGYFRPMTLIVGLVALGAGAVNLREYVDSKGGLVCQVGDAESKKRTLGRIERIVNAPLTTMSIFGVVALAFIVNSIEFACSAALPAIFTHTLALRHLPALDYYGYILLYDLFFMLDDMIIFTLAVLALDTSLGQRYARECKLIGGVVLAMLGVVMVFAPDLLR